MANLRLPLELHPSPSRTSPPRLMNSLASPLPKGKRACSNDFYDVYDSIIILAISH